MITLRGISALLGLFCAVCAIAAAGFAGYEAFIDWRHTSWPVFNAVVASSHLEVYEPVSHATSGPYDYVDMGFAYVVDGGRRNVQFRSAGVPAGAHVETLSAWMDRHPVGSTMAIRMDDPAHPHVVELVDADGLLLTRHPRKNAQTAAFFAVAAVVLLVVARRKKMSSPESVTGAAQ